MVTHRLNPPPAARSGARNLREMGDVCIATAEHQSVLRDERRDPHVIRGYRCPLLAQLPNDRRVVVRRVFVGNQHGDTVPEQEPPLSSFVVRAARPHGKTRPQFGERGLVRVPLEYRTKRATRYIHNQRVARESAATEPLAAV